MSQLSHASIVLNTSAAAADEDATLLAGIFAGSPRAWAEFHRRFDTVIHRCVAKVLRRFGSVVSTDDVCDVRCSFYVTLLGSDMRKLRGFDPAQGTRLASWIGLLATHAAYDHLRKVRREGGKAELSAAAELACTEPTPFERVMESQRAAHTARTLESFSEKDREFAELYFGEGQDPAVIAETMQISVKTVYSKKHKIQARLSTMLRDSALLAA
jgi:RNA polymerase sigma-70 factor, ECF subfamily